MFDLYSLRKYILKRVALAATLFAILSFSSSGVIAQTRSLGLDISAYQGNISQSTWNNIYNLENRDFVFIRATRGGSTGEDHRQGGYPSGNNSFYNLSQRYDDPYFVQNITRATNAGLFAGPYHYSRHDVIASTPNSGGIANTGMDEADHFIEMAGAWMRPGYLLPVYDLEGPLTRTEDQLAQFLIDFSSRIHDVMGIRPTMYINGSYSTTLQSVSSSLRNQVVAGFPNLWDARYAYQSNPNSSEVQTAHPKDTFGGFYGPWDDSGVTHPWSFWQYASQGRLQSFNNGGSNLDFDVANGGTEFLKDKLVPALWTNDSDGQWTSLANWNSGQAPIAPVQSSGQLARVGPLTLPTVRLPGVNDTVILDRPNANILVTLSSGIQNIRKLYVHEALDVTGGILNVIYVPTSDSTPISAQFSAPVSLTGSARLRVHTLQVDAFQSLTVDGATLTFDTINLMPHNFESAEILMAGDFNFTPLGSDTATIANGAGTGNSGRVDLGGANRVFNIADGDASVDLSIEVPVINGSLTKSGPGTLALLGNNSFTGDAVVEEGVLSLSQAMLPDDSNVSLSTGGILDLDFSGTPDVIGKFSIDGASLAVGTWGAVGSTAQFITPLITGTGMLQVTSINIPGDFDGDNDVDGDDLTTWQNAYGNGAGADADQDGDSDGQDFLIWQRNYTGAMSPPPVTAVPEPGSRCLIGLGLALAVVDAAGVARTFRTTGRGADGSLSSS